MKTITLLAILALTPIVAHSYEHRDRFGNLIYTGERRGNETVYRDRYGNTFETEARERGRSVYRDRFGNEIGEDSPDRD